MPAEYLAADKAAAAPLPCRGGAGVGSVSSFLPFLRYNKLNTLFRKKEIVFERDCFYLFFDVFLGFCKTRSAPRGLRANNMD